MRQVILCGALGRAYGKRFMLDVKSPAEAVRALCANFPKLAAELRGAEERGVRYAVWSGQENIKEAQLGMSGAAPIRIAPVLVGSKRGGVLSIIAGAVLVVAGILVNYIPGGSVFSGPLISAGIAMMLGGIVQLLTPLPKTPQNQAATSDIFSGPTNVAQEGAAVPIILGGPILVGSVRIGASIDTDQIALNTPVAALTADHSSGAHPLTVNFDGSNSSPTTGNLTQFAFSFGDGNTTTQAAGSGTPLPGAFVAHTYAEPGNYLASLTVLNDSGYWSEPAYFTILVS